VKVLPDGTYTTVLVNPKIRGTRKDRIIAAARNSQNLDPGLPDLTG